MKKIAIINGPNLNMLGEREQNVYGLKTLAQIESDTAQLLADKLVTLEWFQSNIEGELVDFIHEVHRRKFDALVINPAGYSHTSVALLDALKILDIPVVEVHLSNVYRRESFRQTMLTAQAASIIMGGIGDKVYYYAVLTQLD